jgi:ribosomal protein S20
MSKKQENRKLITQNKRNKIINKRYTSTIKTLTKLFNSIGSFFVLLTLY